MYKVIRRMAGFLLFVSIGAGFAAEPEAPAAATAATVGGPAASGAFVAPKATIITRPDYFVEGTWGGQSDGKTIGIDGRAFPDYDIYARDCLCFQELLDMAVRSLPAPRPEQFRELRNLAGEQDPVKRKELAAKFSARFKLKPEAAPDWRAAHYSASLNKAMREYEKAKLAVQTAERVRSFAFEDADTPEKAARRQAVRAAVEALARERGALSKAMAGQLRQAWPVFMAKHKDPHTYCRIAKQTKFVGWWQGAPQDGDLAAGLEAVASGGKRPRGTLKAVKLTSAGPVVYSEEDRPGSVKLVLSGWVTEAAMLPDTAK